MIKKSYLLIGELAKRCQISTQTLRFYEKIGLIKPDYIDENTKYRYYDISQITKLVSIKELKYRGFQLASIKEFLATGDLNLIEEIYQKRLKEIQREVKQLNYCEKVLNRRIHFFHETQLLEKEGGLTFNKQKIQIQFLPEREVVFIQKKAKKFSLTENMLLFNDLQNLIRKHKLFVKEPIINILSGLYEEVNQKEMDYEMAYLLEEIPVKKNSFMKTIPGGQYACYYLRGTYQEIARAEKNFYQWLNENQYEVLGPLIRCYLVTYSLAKNADKVVSEFQIKIQKKS